MNTYGQSTSLFLSLSLSPFCLPSSISFSFFLSLSLSPSLSSPKRKVHRCTAILPLHTRPCRAYYENPLWERRPLAFHPLDATRRHRCTSSSSSKKGPREMAPLCVPNLCRAVLRVPLRGAISQKLPSLALYSPLLDAYLTLPVLFPFFLFHTWRRENSSLTSWKIIIIARLECMEDCCCVVWRHTSGTTKEHEAERDAALNELVG